MEKKILKDTWKQGFFKFLAPDGKIAAQRAVYLCPDDNQYYGTYNGEQIVLYKVSGFSYEFSYLNQSVQVKVTEVVPLEVKQGVREIAKVENVVTATFDVNTEVEENVPKKIVLKDNWRIGQKKIFFRGNLNERTVYKDPDTSIIYCSIEGKIAILTEVIDQPYDFKVKELIEQKEETKPAEEKIELDISQLNEYCIYKGGRGAKIDEYVEKMGEEESYKYYPPARLELDKRIINLLIDMFEKNTNIVYTPLRGTEALEIFAIDIKNLNVWAYNLDVGKNVKTYIWGYDLLEIVRDVIRHKKYYNQKYFVDPPFKERPIVVPKVSV